MTAPASTPANPAAHSPGAKVDIASTRPRIVAAVIYLSLAALLALRFWPHFSVVESRWEIHLGNDFVTFYRAASLAFIFATVRVFFNRRFGLMMGLAAALLALTTFVRTEVDHYELGWNSWVALNSPGSFATDLLDVKLHLVGAFILLIAMFFSLSLLAPPRWHIGQYNICETAWPSFVLPTVIMVAWYLTAVSPYRIPLFLCGGPPELTVLHVEKRGLYFRETEMAITRDRRFYLFKGNRRLFQYSFEVNTSVGGISEEGYRLFRAIVTSPEFLTASKKMPTTSHWYSHFGNSGHAPPREWNSNRWFVYYAGHRGDDIFDVDKSQLPKDVLALYDNVQKSPVQAVMKEPQRDICFGFCYDPVH